jgi:hypothetical protein
MSPVTEARELYVNESITKFAFAGVMMTSARRVGKTRASKVFTVLQSEMLTWLDEKLCLESLYASGEIERFKQDHLPQILNKLS